MENLRARKFSPAHSTMRATMGTTRLNPRSKYLNATLLSTMGWYLTWKKSSSCRNPPLRLVLLEVWTQA